MQKNGSNPYPESVHRLMEELARLPGVGRRSAERLAFFLLKSEPERALGLARAISDVKTTVRHCSICFNITEDDPCPICADPRRDHAQILVVEQPKDLIALEQTGMYRGGYHVLMGHLAPLEGIEPDNLTVSALLNRLDHPEANARNTPVTEVVMGLSPNLEGDGTALFLAEEIRKRGITMTRLARGLPAGTQIEYANKAVLADAIVGRQTLE